MELPAYEKDHSRKQSLKSTNLPTMSRRTLRTPLLFDGVFLFHAWVLAPSSSLGIFHKHRFWAYSHTSPLFHTHGYRMARVALPRTSIAHREDAIIRFFSFKDRTLRYWFMFPIRLLSIQIRRLTSNWSGAFTATSVCFRKPSASVKPRSTWC